MTKYGIVLAMLCELDLISTVVGLKLGVVEEANPIMQYFINIGGIKGFVVIKLLISALSIAFMEITYKHNFIPRRKMRIYYKVAIFLFISEYATAFIYVNFI